MCICVAVDSCKIKCKADDFRSKTRDCRMNSQDCACIYDEYSSGNFFHFIAIYLIYNELTIILEVSIL